MSQGNILKEFFNYGFDDAIELHSPDKMNISLVKSQYELAMAIIK